MTAGLQTDRQQMRPTPTSGRLSGAASERRVLALFGLFGVGNFGNKASLRSAVEAASRVAPDVRIAVVCAVPEVVMATFDVDAVAITMSRWELPYLRSPRAVRLILRPLIEVARSVEAARFVRRVDAVVVPGTGILDDFGVRPQQMPWDLFRWTLVAKVTRTPFAFVSVGAGPIEHPVSRWLMKRAARQASYLSFRDEASRSFLTTLGVKTLGDSVWPDVVFGLTPPEPTPVCRGESLRVGVGVMTFHGWENDPSRGAETFDHYLSRMVGLVESLVAHGHSVRLLTGERNDEVAVERLRAELGARWGAEWLSAKVAFEQVDSLEGLFQQIQLTDGVIATRYHNVIAALMMERPTVSVGYAEKNAEVMRALGLDRYCHRIEDFDLAAVEGDLNELVGRWDELLPMVRDHVRSWKQLVEDQYERVFALRRPQRRRSPSIGTVDGGKGG